MQTAETATRKTPLFRAVLYRDGLMIALLAHRPLRLSNFGAIMLGQHLIRQQDGYSLLFSGTEMKGRRAFDAGVPDSLTQALDRYLDHHRPLLLSRGGRRPAASNDALWISATGSAMNPLSIPNRIKKHTRTVFGRDLSVHLFRDCAATTIAIDDPKHARSIMPILGHPSITISEKHYNQAKSLEASRRYQKILDELLADIEAGQLQEGL